MTACPVGAITINAAGAKDVVDDSCVGCKLCTIACPYGTMFYDPATRKAFKCNLCGGDPACAHACPTAAITLRGRGRRPTGSATSPRERIERVLAGGALMARAASDHRRRHRGHERDPDDPRGRDASAPRSRWSAPRSRTRGWCCRTTSTARSPSRTSSRPPAPVLAGWGVKTHLGRRADRARHEGQRVHARRRHRRRVRRLPDRHRLLGGPGAGARAPTGRGVHSFWTLDQARGVLAADHSPAATW